MSSSILNTIFRIILAVIVSLAITKARVGGADEPFLGVDESSPSKVLKYRTTPLRSMDHKVLQAIRHDDRLGLALSAEWELTRRHLGSDSKVSTDQISQFVGFLEGRLRCTTPEWWSDSLRRAERGSEYIVRPNSVPSRNASRLDATTESELKSRIEVDGNTLVIDKAILGRNVKDMCVIRDNSAWYIADRDQAFPARYNLLAFSADGKLKWKCEVWASGIDSFSGQGHFHIVEARATPHHIVIFGVFLNGYYVEVSRRLDGVNLCRFATSY